MAHGGAPIGANGVNGANGANGLQEVPDPQPLPSTTVQILLILVQKRLEN